jgi:TolB protein
MEISMPKFARLATMRSFLVMLSFLILALAPRTSLALEVDVSGGRINPLPIAITPFLTGGGAEEAGATLGDVISNNLGRSGYFEPLPQNSFIEQITDFNQEPRFADWRQIQAKALVTGQVYVEGGRIRVEFKLFDVNSQQQIAAQQFSTSPKNLRRIGHLTSDVIYKALTGIDGYFDTQIVFVDETGSKDQRVKKLAVMDQDGYNVRTLTDGSELVVTPRFSPNSQEITYMSIGQGTPRVYLFNIVTRQKEIVGEFANMSFAPRYSPDGQRVIMSLLTTDGRNSNIYEMDLRSRQLRQLTNTPAINTGPSYAPDGSQITFESDRGGSQQIYVMALTAPGKTASVSATGAIQRPCGRRMANTSRLQSRPAADLPSA